MATLCPSDITKLMMDSEHAGEMETLKLLKSKLPASLHVFHGMHWSKEGKDYTAFGEIDFVVVDSEGQVIIVEQKNGSLDEVGGDLVKRYGNTNKSVSDQIHRMRNNILEKFKQQNPGQQLKLDYLFYCPDYRVANISGAAIDEKRIVDASNKDKLPEIIQGLLSSNTAKSREAEQVLSFFYNEYDLVPDVSTYKTQQRETFVRLSSDMMRFIERLTMHPYRLHVEGTAGSGKSLLAMRMYKQWLEEGKNVLLTCYNNALQQNFRSTLPQPENIRTFHKLCTDALLAHGVEVDFKKSFEPGFWRDLLEQVIAIDLNEEEKFDALIVDEGQDFGPDWFELLQLFLKEDAAILWLDDPTQQIYPIAPAPLDGFVHFKADINYRTPHSIADYIRKKLDVTFEGRNALPGLGVHLESIDDKEELAAKVAHRIKDLRRIGFEDDDIVILSCVGIKNASFVDYDDICGIGLKHFTGTYSATGEPVFTDGRILSDSVYRFKGQQAPAVILVDFKMSGKLSDKDRKVLFVAMTRATVRLELVIVDNKPLAKALKL